MIIKNLANGNEVNVSNTSVCKDEFITAKIHGKEPSPRYYKNYPMLQKIGNAPDGRVMLALEDGWQVVGNRQPNGEAKPAPTQPTQPAASGNGATPAKGDEQAQGGKEAPAKGKGKGKGAKDSQPAPATQPASGKEEGKEEGNTSPASQPQTPPAMPQMPAASAGAPDPYTAWLNALSGQITSNVLGAVEPLVQQASAAAAKASAGGSTRREFVWPDRTTTKVDGVTCEGFDKLVCYLKAGKGVYLWGAAGCGKSHTAEQLAEALGLRLYCQSQILFAHDVKGYGDASGNYVHTPFYKAFTEGGLFFLDEMDASQPEALVVLNQALANRRYDFPVVGNVEAHPDFRFVAAGNTPLTGADTQYTGRSVQDASSRNRFLFHEMKYDRRVELPAIAGGDEETVNFVEDLRQSIKAAGLDLIVSYRQTATLADPFLRANVGRAELLRDAVFGGVEVDELRIIYAGLQDKECEWGVTLKGLFE